MALLILDRLLPFEVVAIAVGAAFAGAAWLARGAGRWVTASASAIVVVCLLVPPLDLASLGWTTPSQRVVRAVSTPRGTLLLTEAAGQRQLSSEVVFSYCKDRQVGGACPRCGNPIAGVFSS